MVLVSEQLYTDISHYTIMDVCIASTIAVGNIRQLKQTVAVHTVCFNCLMLPTAVAEATSLNKTTKSEAVIKITAATNEEKLLPTHV